MGKAQLASLEGAVKGSLGATWPEEAAPPLHPPRSPDRPRFPAPKHCGDE